LSKDQMSNGEEGAMPEAADEMPLMQHQGLSWSWQLDFDALMTALNEPAPWNRPAPVAPVSAAASAPDVGDSGSSAASSSASSEATSSEGASAAEAASASSAAEAAPADTDTDPADADADADLTEAEFAELLEAMEQGKTREVPLTEVAGRIAESLPTGPDLAGWLATSSVAGLEDGALAGMAASYRRLASWAQAGELAVVAELALRSAAADDQIGVDGQGRPARLPDEACAQVSLALMMSHASASWWSDLAVTLRWRLAATGAALAAGRIDLGRARLIADATSALDEETARAVEAKILPAAGDMTTAQLRAALRRAVITADPEGAERRREEAERRAKVSLYPDQDGTASLAGYSLPSIPAAAAMGRITALARALKAAGAGGGIDLLRAQVFLGLLLGTLPYIPPAPDGPPDSPPDGGRESPPDDHEPPGEPPHDGPDEQPDEQPDDSLDEGHRERPDDSLDDGPDEQPDERLHDGPDDPPAGPVAPAGAHVGRRRGEPADGRSPTGNRSPADRSPPAADPGGDESEVPRDGCEFRNDDREPDVATRDRPTGKESDDELGSWSRPPPAWPRVEAWIPSGPAAMQGLRPNGGGLVDVQLPWSALDGESGEPGYLSRIGPITAAQARDLADLAARDSAVRWLVIVTNAKGQAEAVAPVPQVRGQADPGAQPGLVRRVTLTISKDSLAWPPDKDLPAALRRALHAAVLAAERAGQRAAMDEAAAGGCAHRQESPGYRPAPRLREFVTARDVTCRFPTCRQPVWRCDLDHSVPYHKGGRTCACNLGGLCRFHHQIKQHRLWQLIQQAPGMFAWTTPAGRVYTAEPDRHAA
jgi:hypothetical protein